MEGTEVATETAKKVAVSEPTGISAQELATRLAALPIKDPNFAKVARLVNKGVNESVNLSKFMTSDLDDFLGKLPASIKNKDNVQKRIEQMSILTNVNGMKAALSVMTKELVDYEVSQKAQEFSGIKLDADDQKVLAEKLALYRKALLIGLHNTEPYKKAYGVE